MLTKHFSFKKNLYLLVGILSLSGHVSYVAAQIKIGSNPTVIGENLHLEVEAVTGNKTVIQKENGNMGVGTSAPGNKLEIKSDGVNQSGLRFTNLTNVSPTTAGAAILGVNASGDVVVTEGTAPRQFLAVARTANSQGVATGVDIIPDGVIKTNNTIPYNTATGVANLTVGKTYLITANLHCAQFNNTFGTFGSILFGVVNAADNQPLDISAKAELFGHYNPGTGSSGSIQMVFTATAGTESIKLRALQIVAGDGASEGQATIRNDLFSGFTVTEL
ncbi:hypothetical protein DSL64_08410 [Dyadobacter luteus]|uniref:C1q domain-containing protein n=1 Tax=Dyadobacter luteus TaxID=2259619 RepID=A0A3D8YES0_9BACT|nr:hypothetical protein [Dyadobacter luteus]REA62923.1 hypothetical protein DSL64_08410 [Dyadobacter luteus]